MNEMTAKAISNFVKVMCTTDNKQDLLEASIDVCRKLGCGEDHKILQIELDALLADNPVEEEKPAEHPEEE